MFLLLRAVAVFFLCLIFGIIPASHAANSGTPASDAGSALMILRSTALPPYTDVTDAALHSLRSLCEGRDDGCPDIRIRSLSEDGQDKDLSRELIASPPRLLVTLGVKAAKWVARSEYRSDVLFAFLPEAAYRSLGSSARNVHRDSVIFLNHRINDQIRLIRYALPEKNSVGTLFGPASAGLREPLENALAGFGFSLIAEVVTERKSIGPALKKVLERADVFLALPDPLIHNQQTVFTILLATYRKRVPVIGFSESYVKAGALLSLYASVGQIGEQIGETIDRILYSAGRRIPDEQHPSRFSVAVNPSVARSLGIEPPDARQLEERLKIGGTQ